MHEFTLLRYKNERELSFVSNIGLLIQVKYESFLYR